MSLCSSYIPASTSIACRSPPISGTQERVALHETGDQCLLSSSKEEVSTSRPCQGF